MSAWGGRILGVCLAVEEALAEGEWRQSTRSRGLTWEAAVSLREVKRQRRLLKAPPHKASSRSMITLSGGGREDARREDMQRGHLRDKSRFFPPPSTLEQSGRAIISRFFFFFWDCYLQWWQIYEPRYVYPLSRMRRPTTNGWGNYNNSPGSPEDFIYRNLPFKNPQQHFSCPHCRMKV